MKYPTKVLLILPFMFFLSACQGPIPSDKTAQKLADNFLQAVNEGKYDKAFSMTNKDFYVVRPKQAWVDYYKAVKKTMGPIISVKHLRTISDDRYSGHFYLFQYYIKHKNGITKEIVTMVDKINSDAPLKISGHKIDSKKLAKINGEY